MADTRRATQVGVEVIVEGPGNRRVTQVGVEIITAGPGLRRVTQVGAEIIIDVGGGSPPSSAYRPMLVVST